MHRLTVALLGDPVLRSGDEAVLCASRKSLAVFCFVALARRAVPRAEIAALFWGGADPDAARASLRTALNRLPRTLADALVADRHHVAPGPGLDTDVEAFVRLSDSGEPQAWADAAALYRGELLKGLEVDATPEFDDWLARERARHGQRAQSVFDRLIEHHRRRAGQDAARATLEREAAMATARRWCELEPASEAAHRWLIRLHLDAGRSDAARAQFETCKRELALAFGRSPGAETRALIETPTAVPVAPAAEAAPARPAHRQPGTSFVGRVDELAEIERLLAEPACRLLTLQALGGTGKSRLAAMLADTLARRFAHGVVWVALDAVTSPDQVPAAVAHALGVELAARAAPADALCAVLKSQSLLIVLDNLEHLLGAADDGGVAELLLRLLREAPGVRLLVTSREVVGLQEEWIYELRGLPVPASEAVPYGRGEHAAVELFVQRARQAYVGFSPQAEWPHVVRLVRLVEGLPLAIELAAAWVRTIPCADLVTAIGREMQALASRHRDRPDRHASLDAVVRTSWSLLTPEQQAALPPLSLFTGGFTQEAATAVAEAPLRLMSSLVDKSLVRRELDGRLSLHELVRQFCRAQLDARPSDARLAQRRYAGYFAAFLERCRAGIDTARDLECEAALSADLPNLLVAAESWLGDPGADATAEPLLRALVGRGQHRWARRHADRLLGRDAPLPDAERAYVLNWRAHAQMAMGEPEGCLADLAAGLALAEANGHDRAQLILRMTATLAAFYRDDFDDAIRTLDRIDPMTERVGDSVLALRARYFRALVFDGRGQSDAAVAGLRAVLAGCDGVGSPLFAATVRSSLAIPLLRLGEVDEARTLLQTSVPVIEQARKAPLLGRSLITLTSAWLWHPTAPDAAAALASAMRALEIFERAGSPYGVAVAADALGMALEALGRIDDAIVQFRRAAGCGLPTVEVDGKFHLGWLLASRHDWTQVRPLARDLLAIASAHGLEAARRSALLLAAAERSACEGGGDALAWLAALRADPSLDFEMRRLVARLGPDPAAAVPAAPVPADVFAALEGYLSATP